MKKEQLLSILAKSHNPAPHSEQAYLSDIKQQVMQLTILGRTSSEIAQRLNISPNTVRNHRVKVYERIKEELGVKHELTKIEVLTHLLKHGAIYLEPTTYEVQEWLSKRLDENDEDN